MKSTGEILDDLPASAAEALASEAFSAPVLCGRFLDRVEAVWLQSPRAALQPAEVGLKLSAGLAASRLERDRLKVRALGVLGGVQRSLGRHDEAEAAYHLAAEISLTLGEPLGLADLARRLATLRRDQQRFGEARRLAEWAIDCYAAEGDERGRAHTLVELGIVLGCECRDCEETARCFHQALEHLDPEHDAVYYRCAVHNLANTLCLDADSRRLAELDDLIERSRSLGGFEPGSPGALKACWLEGVAAARRGEHQHAEAALDEARTGFLRLGLAAEAATVAMDLARFYLERGRGAEARQLAGELFPIFQALRSQREVTAALNLYVNAAMLDRLSLDLVQRVRGGIAAVGWMPSLPG